MTSPSPSSPTAVAVAPTVGGRITRPGPPSRLAVEITFIGRGLRHTTRNVDALVTSLALPVMILLAFVFVFGTAIDTGVDYVDFVVPGIILLCAGMGAAGTAVGVTDDKVGGVIDRVRTLPVRSSSVLTGHVLASLVRNMVATTMVVVVAVAVGFRPTAGPIEWLAAAGLIVLFVLALTWLATGVGLVARSVEAANAFGFFVLFLPYVSSAFVPTGDMAGGLRWIAEHQPVTPIVETLRGLLTGTPIGADGWLAVGWCLVVLVPSFAWSSWLFRRQART
jgi:ABC-2 type transport system permease protein